ncbi:MAG: hypothetical protein RRY22_04915 [Bacilli bacterium]
MKQEKVALNGGLEIGNSGKTLNDLTNKNIITAFMNGNQTIRYEYELVNLDNSVSAGKELILNSTNHNIKIGKGIKKVEVSANIFLENMANTDYVWCFIRKNDNNVASSIISTSKYFITASISSVLIDVNENDVINLVLNDAKFNDAIRVVRSGSFNTWLTIEAIQ